MASVPDNDRRVSDDFVTREIAAIKARITELESIVTSLGSTVQTNATKLDGIDASTAEILAVLKGARTVGGFIWTNWGKILSVMFAIATSQHWLNPTILAAIEQSFLPK